jgi:hypothetical protein
MAFKKDARLNRLLQGNWNWQDALWGGMILASISGLVYAFAHQ